MIDVETLSAGELRALLHFYADAGVEYLLEEEAVDRIAEFESAKAAQKVQRSVPETERRKPAAPPPLQPATALPVPGDQAIAAAVAAASQADDIASLHKAVSDFDACNLKNSARNTVFPEAIGSRPILVIGTMPSADDDREGKPFSGRQGDLLERMLGAINLPVAEVTLAHSIPWRPPGDRPPTQAEMDICRPFVERLISLVRPEAILMLGNIAVRSFIGNGSTIHSVRGQWQNIDIGETTFKVLPTLHPQDLILAPASKKLAWTDLLAFDKVLKAPTPSS